MATQRNRRPPTRRGNSPLKVNEPGIRYDRGRSQSGGNLTSILVVCLAVAFIILVAVVFMHNKKGNQPAPIPVNVADQKPINTQVAPKVVAPPTEEVEVTKKKKKKTEVDNKNAEPNKKVNIEVSGSEKKPEKVIPAEEVPANTTKNTDESDEPIIPKSFMGGLSNPEMEKNMNKEEARKKNNVNLE